jgi:membrane protease YdiL (CAAX protease family)
MSFIAKIFWNHEQSRLRTFWRLLLHGLVMIVFGAIFFLLATPITGTPEQSVMGTGDMMVFAIVSALTVLASMIFMARLLDRRRFRDYGFRFCRAWWLDLIFGLALGGFLMSAIFLAELAAGWVRVVDTFHPGDGGHPFAVAILFPLVLFVCVGLYEEALSRGYHLRNLAEGFLGILGLGPRGAVVIATLLSSALFALAHANNPNATFISTFNIFLAGGFLAAGYILTGELGISIGLHITWNFFQGNVFGFPVSGMENDQASFIIIEQAGDPLVTGGEFGPEAGLVGIAAITLGVLLIMAWVRMRKGAIRLYGPLAEYRSRTAATK